MTTRRYDPRTERTWEISDIDGSNKRCVTLTQYRAELDVRKKAAAPIMEAMRRGDLKACALAQAAMRKQFPKG
jgi:hypothetical protein